MWELLIWLIPLIAVISFVLGYYFQGWWQKWRAARQINTAYLDVQDDKLQNLHNQEVVDKLLGAVDQIITHNMALEPAQLIERVVLQSELEKVKQEYLAQQGIKPEQPLTSAPAAVTESASNLTNSSTISSESSAQPAVVLVHAGNPKHFVPGKVLSTSTELTYEPAEMSIHPIKLEVNESESQQQSQQASQSEQTESTTPAHQDSSINESSSSPSQQAEGDESEAIAHEIATQALDLALDTKSSELELEALEQRLAHEEVQHNVKAESPGVIETAKESENPAHLSSPTNSQATATATNSSLISQQPLVARSSADFAYEYAVLPADVAHLLELQLVAALIWRQRGDFMKAINIYRHVLAVPTWKGVGHQRAQLDLARCYLQAGMFHKVTELLNPLLDSEVYAAQAMQLLLYFHQVSHNWKEGLALAKRNYTKFKTKTNQHILYHFYHQRLLECYHEIGHRRTMYAFQRLLELHNPHVLTLWMRGNYHFVHEDYASALTDYKSLVAQRIELLPDLIGNIACCFAMLREVGNNLGLFLRDLLRRHPQVDYVLVIYDLYLQQYDFTQHAFGFEFTGKEKNLHELFHNLHSQMTEQLFSQEPQEVPHAGEISHATLEPTSASDVGYASELQKVTNSTSTSQDSPASDATLDSRTQSSPRTQLHRQLYAKPKILDKFVDLIDREAKFRYDVVLYKRLQRLLTWQQQHYSPLVAQQVNALLAQMLTQMSESQMHELLQHQVMAGGKFKLRSSLENNRTQQQAVHQSAQHFAEFAQQQQNLELEAVYACRNCGYAQRHVFWYCQACQKWETVYLKDTQLKHKPKLH